MIVVCKCQLTNKQYDPVYVPDLQGTVQYTKPALVYNGYFDVIFDSSLNEAQFKNHLLAYERYVNSVNFLTPGYCRNEFASAFDIILENTNFERKQFRSSDLISNCPNVIPPLTMVIGRFVCYLKAISDNAPNANIDTFLQNFVIEGRSSGPDSLYHKCDEQSVSFLGRDYPIRNVDLTIIYPPLFLGFESSYSFDLLRHVCDPFHSEILFQHNLQDFQELLVTAQNHRACDHSIGDNIIQTITFQDANNSTKTCFTPRYDSKLTTSQRRVKRWENKGTCGWPIFQTIAHIFGAECNKGSKEALNKLADLGEELHSLNNATQDQISSVNKQVLTNKDAITKVISSIDKTVEGFNDRIQNLARDTNNQIVNVDRILQKIQNDLALKEAELHNQLSEYMQAQNNVTRLQMNAINCLKTNIGMSSNIFSLQGYINRLNQHQNSIIEALLLSDVNVLESQTVPYPPEFVSLLKRRDIKLSSKSKSHAIFKELSYGQSQLRDFLDLKYTLSVPVLSQFSFPEQHSFKYTPVPFQVNGSCFSSEPTDLICGNTFHNCSRADVLMCYDYNLATYCHVSQFSELYFKPTFKEVDCSDVPSVLFINHGILTIRETKLTRKLCQSGPTEEIHLAPSTYYSFYSGNSFHVQSVNYTKFFQYCDLDVESEPLIMTQVYDEIPKVGSIEGLNNFTYAEYNQNLDTITKVIENRNLQAINANKTIVTSKLQNITAKLVSIDADYSTFERETSENLAALNVANTKYSKQSRRVSTALATAREAIDRVTEGNSLLHTIILWTNAVVTVYLFISYSAMRR